MANKNQKQFRAMLVKEKNVAIQVPTHGYHNSPKGAWIGRIASLVKYVHKKKAKPFPAVGEPLTLIAQRAMFYGI